MRPAFWLPALALVFNAFTWGVSWWPFRLLEGQGLHPLWATALIYSLAAAVISVFRVAAWRELLTTPALWVLVLASGTTNAAFNWAVTIGDVVRVVLLFYLMPLWAVLLARVLLHEALNTMALLRVLISLLGAGIVLWPEQGGLPRPSTLADLLGLVGGFSFALNNVMLRREARRSESARALAMFLGGMLIAAALATLLASRAALPWPPAPQWPWVAGAAALAACFLLSNLSLQYGAARLPAGVTAVVMVSEVLFASVSAVALGAGAWSARIAVGGGLLIVAALLGAWHRE